MFKHNWLSSVVILCPLSCSMHSMTFMFSTRKKTLFGQSIHVQRRNFLLIVFMRVLWIFDDVSSTECSWQQIWKFIITWMYSRHFYRRCISHDLHSLTSLLLMKLFPSFCFIFFLISAFNDNFLQTIDDGLWWCSNLLKFTVVLWYSDRVGRFFPLVSRFSFCFRTEAFKKTKAVSTSFLVKLFRYKLHKSFQIISL